MKSEKEINRRKSFWLALAELAIWLIPRAANNRQHRIFTEARIGFGQATHDKKATPGALDNFNVPARRAQTNVGRQFHRGSLAWNRGKAKDKSIDGLSFLKV
jgi:hypothetical protein